MVRLLVVLSATLACCMAAITVRTGETLVTTYDLTIGNETGNKFGVRQTLTNVTTSISTMSSSILAAVSTLSDAVLADTGSLKTSVGTVVTKVGTIETTLNSVAQGISALSTVAKKGVFLSERCLSVATNPYLVNLDSFNLPAGLANVVVIGATSAYGTAYTGVQSPVLNPVWELVDAKTGVVVRTLGTSSVVFNGQVEQISNRNFPSEMFVLQTAEVPPPGEYFIRVGLATNMRTDGGDTTCATVIGFYNPITAERKCSYAINVASGPGSVGALTVPANTDQTLFFITGDVRGSGTVSLNYKLTNGTGTLVDFGDEPFVVVNGDNQGAPSRIKAVSNLAAGQYDIMIGRGAIGAAVTNTLTRFCVTALSIPKGGPRMHVDERCKNDVADGGGSWNRFTATWDVPSWTGAIAAHFSTSVRSTSLATYIDVLYKLVGTGPLASIYDIDTSFAYTHTWINYSNDRLAHSRTVVVKNPAIRGSIEVYFLPSSSWQHQATNKMCITMIFFE